MPSAICVLLNVNLSCECFVLRSVPCSVHHCSLTTSPGEKTFEVKIESPGEHLTRIWLQVLDRKDGSFLVRYRMYATYPDIHVHVLLQHEHVANSPFVLKGSQKPHISERALRAIFIHRFSLFFFFFAGPVYHEGCDCPQPSGSVWEAHMGCPDSFPQIDRDLSVFSSVDPDGNAQEIPQRFGQRQSLCHYTVQDNKVNQPRRNTHVAPKQAVF